MGLNTTAQTTPLLLVGEALREHFFSLDSLAALKLLPMFGTQFERGNYPRILRGQSLAEEETIRELRSTYAQGEYKVGERSFDCKESAFEIPMDLRELKFYASMFDAGLEASRQAMWKVAMAAERETSSLFINTTTFSTGNGKRTDVSSAWTNAAANIIQDVGTAIEAICARTGADADELSGSKFKFWIPATDLRYLIRVNTEIRDSLRYVMVLGIDAIKVELAKVLGVDEVVVPRLRSNSAGEAAADTYTSSSVFGSGWAGVVLTPGEGSITSPGFGRTFVWEEMSPGGIVAESYPDEKKNSIVFRARWHRDLNQTDSEFAQLIDTDIVSH